MDKENTAPCVNTSHRNRFQSNALTGSIIGKNPFDLLKSPRQNKSSVRSNQHSPSKSSREAVSPVKESNTQLNSKLLEWHRKNARTSTKNSVDDDLSWIVAPSRRPGPIMTLATHAVLNDTESSIIVQLPVKQLTFQQWPRDWTLKNEIIITSPYSVYQRLFEKSESHWSSQALTPSLHSLSHQDWPITIHQSLIYWQFPERAAPSAQYVQKSHSLLQRKESVTFSPTEQDHFSLVQSLEMDWKMAFESIYTQWRQGHVPYFYYVLGQLVILFDQSNGQMRAILSVTDRVIRFALREEGIPYSTPFAKTLETKKEPIVIEKESGSESELENNEMPFSVQTSTLNSNVIDRDGLSTLDDLTMVSTCVIYERAPVHALFDLLLNRPVRQWSRFLSTTAPDLSSPSKTPSIVPWLLAPGPFHHATLQLNKMLPLRPLKQQDKMVYRWKLSGWWLPCRLERIMQCLQAYGQVHVLLKTVPGMETFNLTEKVVQEMDWKNEKWTLLS